MCFKFTVVFMLTILGYPSFGALLDEQQNEALRDHESNFLGSGGLFGYYPVYPQGYPGYYPQGYPGYYPQQDPQENPGYYPQGNPGYYPQEDPQENSQGGYPTHNFPHEVETFDPSYVPRNYGNNNAEKVVDIEPPIFKETSYLEGGEV